MRINHKILANFDACMDGVDEFKRRFPEGLEINALWGADGEANALWKELLSDDFLKMQVGWAISVGLLPARIRGDLRGADLSGADLRGADLRWADLRGADLRGADLRKADLRWADLRKADLSGADLRKADLYGADLRKADLYGANLDKYTQWPDGFEPAA